MKKCRGVDKIPGSPEVMAGSGGMVVLRDSVSPAHPGSKRKGGSLRQEMGAAIQERQKGRLTHSKDPLFALKGKAALLPQMTS